MTTIPQKKLKNGFVIPVLGIGTWKIGGSTIPDYDNDQQNIKIIQEALSLGITHIDTAEKYGDGHTEELVGKAIQDFDRSKLFITTKVSKIHHAYKNILLSMQKSLDRLQTDYVDVYLLHSPSNDIPFEETLKAMNYLVTTGKTKYIGVSNFSAPQLKKAQECSKNKLVINQVEYNLLTRNNGEYVQEVESEIIPFCQANDIIISAYRPLAKGFLTNCNNNTLTRLTKKYKKTIAQIALNWLIAQQNIVVIPKMGSKEHIIENLGALNFTLDKEDMLELSKLAL